MRKKQDTKETADPFVRARLHQTLLGVVVIGLGVAALALKNPELAMLLGVTGGKLMPTSMLLGPKE